MTPLAFPLIFKMLTRILPEDFLFKDDGQLHQFWAEYNECDVKHQGDIVENQLHERHTKTYLDYFISIISGCLTGHRMFIVDISRLYFHYRENIGLT